MDLIKPAPAGLAGVNDSLAAAVVAHRAELRRARVAARLALPAETHQQLSALLESHLEHLLLACAPRIVGFCWPYRAEFDSRPLLMRRLAEDAALRLCLPVVGARDQPMAFRAWQADSVMQDDRYGIPCPVAGELLRPDLLLIPVNVFDAQGYRLGYGAGHFDRTLAALSPMPLVIGLGFELARVDSIAPQAHDVPLDAVVTEAGVQVFSTRWSKRAELNKKASP